MYRGAEKSYTQCMSDMDREHLLHKVVAVSGFVFALLILPVAQYFITNGREQAKQETGTVAGVSTDTNITKGAVVQDPATCEQNKEKDLADLQVWYDGRLTALNRDHDAAIKPYQEAIPLITGDNAETEKASLQKLIDEETATYSTKRDQIASAVDSQTKEISSRICATPVPAAQ